MLQAHFFLPPILGSANIVEGIIDLAQVPRDRRRCEMSRCLTTAGPLADHVVLVVLVGLGRRLRAVPP